MREVMTAARGGAKVVLTSRDYIYRDARRYFKEYAYPLLHEQQVVVDAAQLSPEERQILYNHIKLGDQPNDVRSAVKPHLHAAADTEPFYPEAAPRTGLGAVLMCATFSQPGQRTRANVRKCYFVLRRESSPPAQGPAGE